MQITPPTHTEVAPLNSGEVMQTIRLSGVERGKALKIRLRVEYLDEDGNKADHTVDVNLADLTPAIGRS